MAKKPPRKPSVPLGMIQFRANEGVRLIHEDLPEVGPAIEATIVRKFVGALRVFDGRSLVLEERLDENAFPDFEGTIGDRRVGIEVVEAIAPDHAAKRARENAYLNELLPRIQDLEEALRGISVTIVSMYQEPPWPALRSKDGQRLLKELEKNLRDSVPVLQQMGPLGGSLVWTKTPWWTGVMAMRGRPIAGSPAAPVDVHFQGSFPTDAGLVARAIIGKINKQYAPYPNGELWLLVHAQSGFAVMPDELAIARSALSSSSHPFEVVWAFAPSPGQDDGTLALVLP